MADKSNKKAQKLKARLPRGLADRGPAEIAATRAMVETIRATFERYGFDPIETPAMEYTDALGKFLPDQDRPNEGVFSFQDDDEQWLSLRYDLTAPLARHVAENYGTDRLVLPYRSYRSGYVYRNEKPGPGRFRQFMQFDADTVGSASMAADAEMCMLAADTMEALGIKRGDYVVKVNNRKILDGVLQSIGLDGEQNEARRLIAFRAIDKFDRLGPGGVFHLLTAGRKDESGDFTKGAGLEPETAKQLIADIVGAEPIPFDDSRTASDFSYKTAAEAKLAEDLQTYLGLRLVSADSESTLKRIRSKYTNKLVDEGIRELSSAIEFTLASGFNDDRIRFDFSVVRGLEYYTGPVYEVELTFEIDDDKGRPIRFGSVGGGGRYDGLVSRFMGQPVPATGFSIGVSRLQAALTALGKLAGKPAPGPVVVTVFDRDRVADYQRMVSALRAADIRAELYLGNPKNMGNQLKYADRRASPCVLMQGSDEKARNEVTIKDLILGAEIAGEASAREDYLKKQAEAQFAVPEDGLVEAVRALLTRHGLA